MKPINILGKKFGRLLVLSYNIKSAKQGHAYWICICDCGTQKSVRASHLKQGYTKSCGCYIKEISSIRLKKYTTSNAYREKGNPSWKGELATIGTLHCWINKYNKKRKKCDFCFKNKKLDWALKNGKKYSRDIDDYFCLCRSCHLKYDYTPERRNKISKFFKGRKRV